MFFLRHRRSNKTLYFQSEHEIGAFFKTQDGTDFWTGGAVESDTSQLSFSDYANNLVEVQVPRKEARVKVILTMKEKTFLTYTECVSETDTLIEDTLPTHFLNASGQLYVTVPGSSEFLQLDCRVEEHGRRIVFEKSAEKKVEKILKALDAQAQSKMSRAS
jgi:hypothetical protein